MNDRQSIDVVITWVDGDDPIHQGKMRPHLTHDNRNREDIAGRTRFSSQKEIFFCVASIFRFASFVRKIFIVTDEQNPGLDAFLSENFPDCTIPIEIIDHRIIFRGYEGFLPIFSSRAIETLLFRIPGLSEHFVYFNDDFFLLQKINPEDWFADNNVIAYGHWRNIKVDTMISFLKHFRKHSTIGFKDGMREAAQYLGIKNNYYYLSHTPLPMKKSLLECYYADHPDILRENISYKFRHQNQFNPQALFYLLANREGQLLFRKEKELYIKPVKRGDTYLKRKLRYYETCHPRMACVQSLDQATEQDRQIIFEWLKKVFNIHF